MLLTVTGKSWWRGPPVQDRKNVDIKDMPTVAFSPCLLSCINADASQVSRWSSPYADKALVLHPELLQELPSFLCRLPLFATLLKDCMVDDVVPVSGLMPG